MATITRSSCFCCELNPNPETMRDLEDAKNGRVKYLYCRDISGIFN